MTGNKLRLLREFRNYSQKYVAKKLGITQNTYSRVENNQTKITTERLQQIAEILNMPVSELVSSDDFVIHCGHSPSHHHHLSPGQEQLEHKIASLEHEIKGLHNEKNRILDLLEKLSVKVL